MRCFKLFALIFHLVQFIKCWRQTFLELNFKRLYRSPGKQKNSRCLVFMSSKKQKKKTTREISHFRAVTAKKKCAKKRNARAELLFFLIKPVAFLPFSLPFSLSSLLIKLSNVKLFWQLLRDIFSRYSSGPEEGLFC